MMFETIISGGFGLVVIWLVITVIASVLAGFIYPWYKKALQYHKDSSNQTFTLLVYGILPPIAAALVVLLLTSPQLSSSLVPEHCHLNGCEPHLPEIAFSSYVGVALVWLSVMTLLTIVVVLKVSLTKASRLLRTLNTLSQFGPDINYRIIDSPELLAWCAGIWRPQIYLSRGLVEVLTKQQLQVVVVHELTHIVRHDNLKKWLLCYATLFWPPRLRSAFLNDFSFHVEQACEQATASRLDNSVLVAQVMQIIGEKFERDFANAEVVFEEKNLVMDVPLMSSAVTDAKSSLWAWLLIVIFWVLEISLLTGITHLGLEWATAETAPQIIGLTHLVETHLLVFLR
jgi:Zn-dependent protease with chaperone function